MRELRRGERGAHGGCGGVGPTGDGSEIDRSVAFGRCDSGRAAEIAGLERVQGCDATKGGRIASAATGRSSRRSGLAGRLVLVSDIADWQHWADQLCCRKWIHGRVCRGPRANAGGELGCMGDWNVCTDGRATEAGKGTGRSRSCSAAGSRNSCSRQRQCGSDEDGLGEGDGDAADAKAGDDEEKVWYRQGGVENERAGRRDSESTDAGGFGDGSGRRSG